MNPLELIEFEMETIALTTNPTIVFALGSRAPLRPGQMIGERLVLSPECWWGRNPSSGRIARTKGDQDRRAARAAEERR